MFEVPETLTAREYNELMEQMLNDGYKRIDLYPPDAEVVAEYRCDACNGALRGQGFYKRSEEFPYDRSSGSYRAFAICTQCGNVDEF